MRGKMRKRMQRSKHHHPTTTSQHHTQHEIRDYAAAHPEATWRSMKRQFEATHADKTLTQSQISRTLNPKNARGPPHQAAIDALETP